MPEIDFSIDTTSGEFRLHIKGIAGPACNDVAALVKGLLGEPSRQSKTAEHYLRPRVNRQVQQKSR